MSIPEENKEINRVSFQMFIQSSISFRESYRQIYRRIAPRITAIPEFGEMMSVPEEYPGVPALFRIVENLCDEEKFVMTKASVCFNRYVSIDTVIGYDKLAYIFQKSPSRLQDPE